MSTFRFTRVQNGKKLRPATLADAIASARKGGTIVLTGLSRIDAQGSFPMLPFVMQEKRVIGSGSGSAEVARPATELPRG